MIGRDGDRLRQIAGSARRAGPDEVFLGDFPLTTGCPFWTLSVSPGPATIRLMKLTVASCGVGSSQAAPLLPPARCSGRRIRPSPAASAPCGGWKTTMSPILGSEVVEEAVDQNPLADVERGLHRLRRDLVRLDDEGLNPERQPERERDDDDELEERALGAVRPRDSQSSASSGEASASLLARLLGSRLAPRSPPSAGASSASLCGRIRGFGGLRPPPAFAPRPRPRRPRSSSSGGSTSSASASVTATPSASTASASSRRRRRARPRSPSAARRRGRACPPCPAGSRASPAGRRRARRPRASRSSASAAGRSARRQRRTTACGP